MECRHGNFWMGLGVGSILGCVLYRLSRTAKAKQLENQIYEAIQRMGREAHEACGCMEDKAKSFGVKAVEAGAGVADKVAVGADKMANEADKMADKAKEKWEK